MTLSAARIPRLLWRAARRFFSDGCLDQAAAVAFYSLLALVPSLYLLGVVAGRVLPVADPTGAALSRMADFLPAHAASILVRLGESLPRPGETVAVAIPVLVWIATTAFTTLEGAVNLAFGTVPERKYWLSRLKAFAGAFTVTALLLVLGTAGLLLLDPAGGALGETWKDRFLSALFHSVSARTAGFNTVDVAGLAPAALFLILLLMWIGGSPASTAGGVKTTTVAVALLTVLSIAGGKERVELFRHRLGDASIQRAFATVIISVSLLSVSILALLAFEVDDARGDLHLRQRREVGLRERGGFGEGVVIGVHHAIEERAPPCRREPTARAGRLEGDIMILGAGGKMGPTLAMRAGRSRSNRSAIASRMPEISR